MTAVCLLLGCAGGQSDAEFEPVSRDVETGKASYYSDSLHGNLTANGEIYDRNAWTAAHRTLPFGTWIRVRNLANGRSVRLRVNDRGPFVNGRIVDVSRRAAEMLDFVEEGLTEVTLEILD